MGKKVLGKIDTVEVNKSLERQVRAIEPGFVQINQQIKVGGTQTGTDVTGPYWILGFVELKRGQITYKSGHEDIFPPAKYYAMFLPPFSIVKLELQDLVSKNFGFASQAKLPADLPKFPVVFIPKSRKLPESIEQAFKIVREGSNFKDVPRAPTPSGASLRIKTFIEQNYTSDFRMTEIAKKLKSSSAVISRYFRKDFGMTPIQYRHWLRVVDAMVRLIEGSKVVSVAHDVGFQTISQFYEQFEKIASASPAKYRLNKSKNRKK